MLSGISYFLIFAVLLPGELLWWGSSLDGILADSCLAKHLLLNPVMDLPKELFLITGVIALGCMVRGIAELSRRSHAGDPLLFGGFPFYMLSLLLYFRMPCALAVEIPLIVLGTAAVWHAYRPEGRPAFLPPRGGKGRAPLKWRLRMLPLLAGVLFGACVLFQEGVQLWLFASRWTPGLIFLPLAGLLLPKQGELRDYVAGSVYALILCGFVSGGGSMLISDSLTLADYEISVAYIFLMLELALAARSLLPKIRNNSLLILPFCFALTRWIVPAFCDPLIISCTVYILYLLIDNRRSARASLFRLMRRIPAPRFAVRREFAALSWGVAALLSAYLAGPDFSVQILAGIAAVFAASLLRIHFLNNPRSDHIILRHFPYALEIFLLLLTGIACSPVRNGVILPDAEARIGLMIVMSSFAAAAALLQTVWNGGAAVGKYLPKPLPSLFRLCFGNACICFLMVLLFFLNVPASILLGYFFIFTGILQIWAASGDESARNLGRTTGWVLIAVGQFIFISSSVAQLPDPKWTRCAAIAGGCAFAALYLTWLFDFYCRKKRKLES